MLRINSRIAKLIETLEGGGTVTQLDVDRAATLQALDYAAAGEAFVNEMAEREAEQTERFRQLVEGA